MTASKYRVEQIIEFPARKEVEKMSPFYTREGENWVRWDGRPLDLRDEKGKAVEVMISSVEDPNQVRIGFYRESGIFVREEDGGVIFPSDKEDGKVVNRRGFAVVDASTDKTVSRVIYSKEPIK